MTSNPNTAFASGTVTDCDQASLEATLAGGGTVTFGCNGTIVLTNTISITSDTLLDGTGQSVTISGNDLVRLFTVGSNVSFTIFNLDLAHGNDVGAAGDGQTPGEDGYGGAVFIDGGVLHATNCRFSENRATGGFGNNRQNGGGAYGGAIYNRSGSLNLTNCIFMSNLTVGGNVHASIGLGQGGAGMGGAIYNANGTLRSFGTRLLANVAKGGLTDSTSLGGHDGPAFGGALYSTGGTVLLRDCTISTNKTVVGPPTPNDVPGPCGGGAFYVDSGSVTIVSSAFSFNQCSGDGGRNGATEGNGGAVFNLGEFYVTNCTFLSNEVIGGIGRLGSKPGNGGAIYNLSLLTAVNTTFDKNSAIGGRGYASLPPAGSAGTNGNGGAIYSTGTVAMLNCTLFQNVAVGGDGANVGGSMPTRGGPGNGGGVFVSSGSFAATNLTFAENSAKGGLDGTFPNAGGVSTNAGPGVGGALYISSGGAAIIVNTILANSLSGSNCFGTLSDAGHNISSDASCNFTTAGSLNNIDPKLGPFGNYGGPTLTIPLLSGSPAIDAGDAAACPSVDQRGVSRPFGVGCDIGAFESAPPYTVNGHIHGYLSSEGVVVTVGSNSVPVDASGFYTFTGLIPGTYLLTPTAPETRFVPGRRVVKVGPDSTDIDFNAYRLKALTVETSANRDFQIVFAGDIEGTYRTEISTDLIDWSFYSTNRTDTNGVFVITNLYFGAGGSMFLRVVKP